MYTLYLWRLCVDDLNFVAPKSELCSSGFKILVTWGRNASVFKHFLAHFPNILVNELRGLMKREKENGKRELGDVTPLYERKPILSKRLDAWQVIWKNGVVIPINDKFACRARR